MKEMAMIVSDLHAEENGKMSSLSKYLKKVKGASILILAGDVCTYEKYDRLYSILLQSVQEYEHVLYVPGNHDYRGVDTSNPLTIDIPFRKLANDINSRGFGTLHFLNCSKLTLLIERQEIVFLGTTLWTNAGWDRNEDRDYHIPSNVRQSLHLLQTSWLVHELNHLLQQNVVVITHHPPFCREFVAHSEYYYNRLESITRKVNVWVYGHLHDGVDFTIGNCKMICNPIGTRKEKRSFRPKRLSLCALDGNGTD